MFSLRLEKKLNEPTQDEYDYIIVGAGACGTVMAAQLLAECPGASIALIEAGGYHAANYGPYIQNMAAYGTVNDYATTLEDHLFNAPRKAVYHRGLGLGGSTITNGAVWVDTRSDLCKWADVYGLPSWANSLDKHYSALYKQLTPSNALAKSSQIGQSMFAAFRDGFFNPDGERHGIRFAESVMNQEKRRDVFTTLLGDYFEDPRLTLIFQSRVNQIHFSQVGEEQKATAISFVKDSITHQVRARRKIILTAGTVATPTLLQQSGISQEGPLIQLPVGNHLKVHHMIMLSAHIAQPIPGLHATNMDVSAFCSGLEDFKNPHSHEAKFKVQTFIQRDRENKPINIVLGCFPFKHYSEGCVRHNPADPMNPIIQSSVSAHPTDQENLIEALYLADAMMRKLHEHKIVHYTPPFSDATAKEYVASNYFVDPHFIATCRVGSVVNEQFHVMHCNNLMVADASVIPEQTSGNCISAAMMIARLAADVVKHDWQKQSLQAVACCSIEEHNTPAPTK